MLGRSDRCGFLVSGRRALSVIFAGLFVLLSSYHIANAAVPATCDPEYWNAMRGKAWMEAQREVSQNQNLIYKADSVLEYSCFNNFLRALAGNALFLFSENEAIWLIDVARVNPESMDNALNILVANSVNEYIAGSFGHTFLGGRSGEDYEPVGANEAPGYVYECGAMQAVWNAARCMNFNQTADIDDFFDLTRYNGWDPRSTLPPDFTCAPDPRWEAQQNLANNTPEVYQEQVIEAQLNFFEAGVCDAAPPIPTGIQVQRRGGAGAATYAEYICVNPGCALARNGTCAAAPAP